MTRTGDSAAGSTGHAICLLTDVSPDATRALLSRCGLSVWSCESSDAFVSDPRCESTLCVVVDLRRSSSLEALEALRQRDVPVPAILCVDRGEAIPAARLAQASVLDVLERPIETRALLGWVGCVCVAKSVVDRQQARLVEDKRTSNVATIRRVA
jgi:FixJ family two-component response regulator